MFPHENSLIPIFLWRESAADPEQVGTGVYLLMGDRSYLFTAGHVIDHMEEGDLCIPTRHGVQAISGGIGTSILASGKERSDDRLDLGYIRLDLDHHDERHPQFVHMPGQNIDLACAVQPGDFCSVGGYPLSKGSRTDQSLSSEVYSYVGIAAEHSEYKRLGYDPRAHVLVKYYIKKGMFPEGDRVNPPHPRGLSGGGIFRLAGTFPIVPQGEPRMLIAVMHSYIRRENYFVGTKLSVYLVNLHGRYPAEVQRFGEA